MIKFFLEAYTLKDNTTYDEQTISSDETVVKAKYLSCNK